MKTILITGATTGIGKLVALKLHREGHTVLIHGRSESKVQATLNELNDIRNSSDIQGFVADLSNFSEVRRFAQEVKESLDHLDVLINNAGVFKSDSAINAEGLELRLAVNYLAPVILTTEIEKLLRNGSSPRVINLSSAAQAPVSLAALEGTEPLIQDSAYAQSKLALTMWSFNLAKEWDFATVIAVNPGSLLNTRMAHEAYGQHWSPAEKGGDILYALATSEEFSQSTGKYFDNDRGQFNHAHPDAYDNLKIQELISKTNQLIKS
ncbi:MAG: SDR family NAD(P)-dependent oxidoreductase [Bacteroidota bacterium]